MSDERFYCETHNDLMRGSSKHSGSDCSVLRIRESRDIGGRLVALLMEERCPAQCTDGKYEVVVTTPPFEDSGWYPCEACDGSGWRPRYETTAYNYNLPTAMWAVVPLGQEEGNRE